MISRNKLTKLLRVVLLFVGGLFSLFIFFIGFEYILICGKGCENYLFFQEAILVGVGGGGVVGIAISAFFPKLFKMSSYSRRIFICIPIFLPLSDLSMMFYDGFYLKTVLLHVFVSVIFGATISFAISTAWLGFFNSMND